MSAEEIIQIGLVISRQRSLLLSSRDTQYNTFLFGELDFPENLAEFLRFPFLYPSCSGEEKNLAECKQHGLGVAIPASCYEGNGRMFFSTPINDHNWDSSIDTQLVPPKFVFFLNITAMSISASRNVCKNIPSFYVRGQGDEATKLRGIIESHVMMIHPSYIQVLNWLQYQLLPIPGFWIYGEQMYDNIEKEIAMTQGSENKMLSVICTVYNDFYPFQCGGPDFDYNYGDYGDYDSCSDIITVPKNNSGSCEKIRANDSLTDDCYCRGC